MANGLVRGVRRRVTYRKLHIVVGQNPILSNPTLQQISSVITRWSFTLSAQAGPAASFGGNTSGTNSGLGAGWPPGASLMGSWTFPVRRVPGMGSAGC